MYSILITPDQIGKSDLEYNTKSSIQYNFFFCNWFLPCYKKSSTVQWPSEYHNTSNVITLWHSSKYEGKAVNKYFAYC